MARVSFNEDQMNRIVRTIVMVEGRTRDFHHDYSKVMDTIKFNYGEQALTPSIRKTVMRVLEEE